MKIEFKKLLFVGPHPDDVELGCGGTIARYSRSIECMYLVLSPCLEDPRNKKILDEMQEATERLGITPENVIVKNLPRRILHEHRKEIREILISVRDSFKPQLVFCPSLRDLHQDHSVVAEETLRLFRDTCVTSYEAARSSIFFQPDLYFELSKNDLDRKIQALMCYKSQYDRYYFNPEVIEALARTRGNQVRTKYAEAFEVLRMVI